MAGVTVGGILKNLIFHGQVFLVYPAAFETIRTSPVTPFQYGLPYQDVEITTSDNVRLRCYLIEPCTPSRVPSPSTSPPKALVIMFHGNGMDHGDLLSRARWYSQYGCRVLTVSYRGYAASEGVPSERGLQRDAQAALDYVLNNERLNKHPIVVYGLSLGGAVAVDVTSKNPDKITCLILENTFTSIPNIVRSWPLIGPLSFLCTQRWNSASKVSKIPRSLPILFLSGRDDKVVPPSHMDQLASIAAARGQKPTSKPDAATPANIATNTGKGIWGGLFRKQGVEPSEELNPPEYDLFGWYTWGGHVDTHTQPRYWQYVKVYLDRSLHRNEGVSRDDIGGVDVPLVQSPIRVSIDRGM